MNLSNLTKLNVQASCRNCTKNGMMDTSKSRTLLAKKLKHNIELLRQKVQDHAESFNAKCLENTNASEVRTIGHAGTSLKRSSSGGRSTTSVQERSRHRPNGSQALTEQRKVGQIGKVMQDQRDCGHATLSP